MSVEDIKTGDSDNIDVSLRSDRLVNIIDIRLSVRPHQRFVVSMAGQTAGNYLEVFPEVVWLDESNGFSDIFNVKSNTDWIIIKEE